MSENLETLVINVNDKEFELTAIKLGILRKVRQLLKLKSIFEITERLGQLDDDVILTILQLAIEKEHKEKVSLDSIADSMEISKLGDISKFLANAFGVAKEEQGEKK